MRRQFHRGQTLFRQGDPSDGAMRVISGFVEVLREIGDDDMIVLGTVQPGEFLGEMGVIEDRPRSATARAATDLEVEVIEPRDFLDLVSRDPDTARELILRLSVRLREMEDRITARTGRRESGWAAPPSPRMPARSWGEPPPEISPAGTGVAAVVADIAGVTISPAGIDIARSLGEGPIPVRSFPFLVGRASVPGEPPPRRRPDLLLHDNEPFRLSRSHFTIERVGGSGAYLVRDLNSTLGTVVNGHALGYDFGHDSAELKPGENIVTAGGMDSPFAFTVSVPLEVEAVPAAGAGTSVFRW